MHTLETQRLELRPWQIEDAEALYKYAKNPAIGPAAGWPPHTSVENSRMIIKNVFSEPHTYAIVLKETSEPIGSIGIKLGNQSDLVHSDKEAEIGYWIAQPYWGQGLAKEALQEIVRHSFEELALERLWCGYHEGNDKSKRVQEKVGFVYQHTLENQAVPLLDEVRHLGVTCLLQANWKK